MFCSSVLLLIEKAPLVGTLAFPELGLQRRIRDDNVDTVQRIRRNARQKRVVGLIETFRTGTYFARLRSVQALY